MLKKKLSKNIEKISDPILNSLNKILKKKSPKVLNKVSNQEKFSESNFAINKFSYRRYISN